VVQETVVIDERFRGPPDSANGGYTCGRLAEHVEGHAVEVTLRLPPPLGRPLTVQRRDGGALLLDGETVVAEAEPAELELELPEPVDPTTATEAARGYLGFDVHPFPGCFVCGPQRTPGDGLRIFPGRVAGRGELYACPWTPGPDLAGPDSAVRRAIVWASLDCPTASPVANRAGDPPIVLARMRAELRAPVQAGEPHVLVSWPIEVDGRKRHAGSALFDAAGKPLACARALWIELRRQT
jgi:hypothetical protein